MTFNNYAREAAQIRGLERTGRSMFRTDSEARVFLTKAATALGLPRSAKISNLKLAGDNAPGHGDTNRTGIATATFVVHPRDNPFLHCGNGMTVSVDPEDGVLTYFAASWDNVVLPSEPAAAPTLARATAERLATAAYLKQQRPQFRRANAPTSAKLGWVFRTGPSAADIREAAYARRRCVSRGLSTLASKLSSLTPTTALCWEASR